MYARRVNHHEHQADERREHYVHHRRDEFLDVGPDLLQLAQSLAAPLVLEEGIGKLERVLDAVGVDAGADLLRDEVHEIILEILGHAGYERDTHGRA